MILEHPRGTFSDSLLIKSHFFFRACSVWVYIYTHTQHVRQTYVNELIDGSEKWKFEK